MPYLSPDLRKALEKALRAFGAEPDGTTTFARYWNAVGAVEDYAAMAATPAERSLVELMRYLLVKELRSAAPYDALHQDAPGVQEFLHSPPWRPARKFR